MPINLFSVPICSQIPSLYTCILSVEWETKASRPVKSSLVNIRRWEIEEFRTKLCRCLPPPVYPALNFTVRVFWSGRLCRWMCGAWRLKGSWCSHLQSQAVKEWLCSSAAWTWRRLHHDPSNSRELHAQHRFCTISEGSRLHQHRCGNLKSLSLTFLWLCSSFPFMHWLFMRWRTINFPDCRKKKNLLWNVQLCRIERTLSCDFHLVCSRDFSQNIF